MKKLLFVIMLLQSCYTFAQMPTGYCTASANYTYGYDITNVTIKSLNHSSTSPSSPPQHPGYNDFTTLCASSCTNLTIGSTNNISISFNHLYSAGAYLSVYIDVNRDGAFTANELLFSKNTPQTTTYVTGTVTIPTNAVSGITRMRVMSSNAAIAGPCNAGSTYILGNNGEAEDYAVFLAAIDCSLSTMTVSPTTLTVCENVPFTLTASGADSYSWTDNTNYFYAPNNSITTSTKVSRVYKVTGSFNNGCNAITKTINVNVPALAAPTITESLDFGTGCLDDPENRYSFKANSPGATNYTWTYTNSCGTSGTITTPGGITLSAGGVIIYIPKGTVYATNGCSTSPTSEYQALYRGAQCFEGVAGDNNGCDHDASEGECAGGCLGEFNLDEVAFDLWVEGNNGRYGKFNEGNSVKAYSTGSDIEVVNNSGESLSMSLMSTNGTLIKNMVSGDANIHFNTQDVSSGIYLLVINGQSVSLTTKVSISH